jgi:hypothetical protein
MDSKGYQWRFEKFQSYLGVYATTVRKAHNYQRPTQNAAAEYLLQRFGLSAAIKNAGKSSVFCSVFFLASFSFLKEKLFSKSLCKS